MGLHAQRTVVRVQRETGVYRWLENLTAGYDRIQRSSRLIGDWLWHRVGHARGLAGIVGREPPNDIEQNRGQAGPEQLLVDVAAAIHDFEESTSQPAPQDDGLEPVQKCTDEALHALGTFTAEWDAVQVVFKSAVANTQAHSSIEAEVRKIMQPGVLFSAKKGAWLSVFSSHDGGTLSFPRNEGRSDIQAELGESSITITSAHTQVAIHSCTSCSAYFMASTLEDSLPAVISSELLYRYELYRGGAIEADHDTYKQSIDALRRVIERLICEKRRSLNLDDSIKAKSLGKDGPIGEILAEYGYDKQGDSNAYHFLTDLETRPEIKTRLVRSWLELTVISALQSNNQGNELTTSDIPTDLDWLQLRRPSFDDLISPEELSLQDLSESQTSAPARIRSQSPQSTRNVANSLVMSPFTPLPPRCIDRVNGQDLVLSWKDIIGEGGSGFVFKMKHPLFGEVAIKSTRPVPLDESAKRKEYFLSEARIWKHLKHINLLPFLGVVTSMHNIYLISAFAPNGTLPEYVKTHPHADKLSLIVQVAEGIEYLHGKGYVHGDIKGSNVLVSAEETALLTDFGLSKVANTVTTSGRRGWGSTRWQSPEILNEGGGKTFRSDVYAFSMTILEVFSGERPYHHLSTDESVVLAIVTGKRPHTSIFLTAGRQSSLLLQSICNRCWDADPWKRPSMGDVLKELGAVPAPVQKSLMPILRHLWLVLAPPFIAVGLFSSTLSLPHGPAAILATVLFLPIASSFVLWVFSNGHSHRVISSSWNVCRTLWNSLYCVTRECWYRLNDASQTLLVAGLIVVYVSGLVVLVLWYHTLAISQSSLTPSA